MQCNRTGVIRSNSTNPLGSQSYRSTARELLVLQCPWQFKIEITSELKIKFRPCFFWALSLLADCSLAVICCCPAAKHWVLSLTGMCLWFHCLSWLFILHFLWNSNSLSLYVCSVLCLATISDEMINYHFAEWKWDSYSHYYWRPNNSAEAKYIWIPKHFNHKYIDFTYCMASLFCGCSGVAQDKPGRWACVNPVQGSGGPWPLLGSLGVAERFEPCCSAIGAVSQVLLYPGSLWSL